MATVSVTPMSVKIPNVASAAVAASAITVAANDIVKIDAANKHLTIIWACGGTAGDINIDAGNGVQGTNPLTIKGTASSAVAIELDTAAFEQVAGANKGFITGKATQAGTLYVTGA